jgi:hypothetical protein
VKTTVDLPDSLYKRARIRAAERGTTLRAVLIESLEQNLAQQPGARVSLPSRDRFRLDEHGWPVLRRDVLDTRVVTQELVERLREEEGV